jgi:16S rRNA (guanine966-N2)-methyltransferase
MRIIAGKYRGKKLLEYHTESTRPTTDRVKENVFNILSNMVDFAEIKVLDLFAGTGQYGIECISRGCKDVTFNDLETADIIKKNLKSINETAKVYSKNYLELLDKNYDLIFLDPPYKSNYNFDNIKSGLLIFETDKKLDYNYKKYGKTYIYIIDKRAQANNA